MKEKEIKDLAQALRLDRRITKECVNDLFSQNSVVIDSNIVDKEIVYDFLMLCIELEKYNNNDTDELLAKLTLIHQFFDNNFNSDPLETLIYFFNDNFFAPVLHYLIEIEKLVYNEAHNNDISGFEGLPYLYNVLEGKGYFNYCDTSESKSNTVDRLVEIFARREKVQSENYAVNIAPELIRHLGYRIFESRIIRESIIENENMRRDKSLSKITQSFVKFRAKRNKTKNYFIYCLCQKLYDERFGRRKSFKIIAAGLSLPWKTVHRRFYDVEKDMKYNGIHYKNLIQLEYKELFNQNDKNTVDAIVSGVKSHSNIDDFISKLN